MGGGGSTSATNRVSVENLSDAMLNYNISRTTQAMNSLENQMTEAAYKIQEAQASPRDGRTERVSSAQSKYYSLQDRYNSYRDRYNELQTERERRTTSIQQPTTKTFVNSFGEATTRNITNVTYEREMRSQEREVERFLRRY